jgi:hypothetical protein
MLVTENGLLAYISAFSVNRKDIITKHDQEQWVQVDQLALSK